MKNTILKTLMIAGIIYSGFITNVIAQSNDEIKKLFPEEKAVTINHRNEVRFELVKGNLEIITETQHWLSKYPEILKQYNSGIEKYKNRVYERNLLDDMRLTLELLLKAILGNQKSLENQLPEIGKYQKEKGLSTEFTSMFNKLLDYYSKYQNNYVKHNDKVISREVEFIIELTTLFMRNLIK